MVKLLEEVTPEEILPPEPPPVPPPKPPAFKPPARPEFAMRAEEWYAKGVDLRTKAGESEKRVAELEQRVLDLGTRVTSVTAKGFKLEEAFAPFFPAIEAGPQWLKSLLSFPTAIPENTRFQMRAEIDNINNQILTDIYLADVYQSIPIFITAAKSGSGVPSPAIILSNIGPIPPNITSELFDQLLSDVTDMVEAIAPIHEVPTVLPEMALEAEKMERPPLEAPVQVSGIPVNINRLTIDAIKMALTTPFAPRPVLSEAEYIEFLEESGQISDKADLERVAYYDEQAKAMIDAWQEQANMLEAYRSGIAEMPEFKAVDLLKEMVIMPGMALLDVARFYFEHVSMPLAGAVWKTILRPWRPDLEAAYQQFKKEEGTWKALGHAWEEWDVGDGEGAWEWMLKYMLMEGLVDPLSYVGWGLAAKITRPLGAFGRGVAGFERGVAAAFELPFDALKWPLRVRWAPELVKKLHLPERYAGQHLLPRTLGQKATIAMYKAGQAIAEPLEKRFGKALWQMNRKELRTGIDDIVKYTLRYGHQVDNSVTRAGRELLDHVPFTEKEVWDVARRLNTSMNREHITKNTVEVVDRIFEDFFATIRGKKKLATAKESGARLVAELSGTNSTDMVTIATKYLEERAAGIISDAMSFGGWKSAQKSARQLMKRNYSNLIKTETSGLTLARSEMGIVNGMLTDVAFRVQRAWAGSIDRWIIRPFAESYLTFALYGPMNVIEDIIRHGLGGAFPGTKTYKALTRKWYGTRMDQTLVMADRGISETMGILRARPKGEVNNWILQLGGFAKGFGDKLYGALVEFPGRVSMGVRIHYIDAMATKILKEIGGEPFERLAKAATKFTGTTNAKVNRQLNQAATELAAVGASREAFDALKSDFTRAAIVRRELDDILLEHPGITRSVTELAKDLFDDNLLFREGGISINQFAKDADAMIIDDFLKSSEHAFEGYEALSKELTALEVRNPEEMAQLMSGLNYMSTMYGATPKQIMGRAVESSRGLAFAERQLAMDKAMDSITIFRERAGASMDRLSERIKVQMSTVYPDNPQYVTGAERLFDLQTAKRLKASELGESINGWRHNLFAEADPSDLKTNEFWDSYSLQISERWSDFNVQMARADAIIDNTIEDLMRVGGVTMPTRPPLKITNRPLAANDIARLLQVRGDDISRGILDVMVPQNDRDFFVEYIMGKVRVGDEGFTRESVGKVYDSLMDELIGGAENASWVSGQRVELEAVRRDLHSLQLSKMLPEDEVTNITKYLDDTADAVENIMNVRVPAIGKQPARLELREEYKTYASLKQQAMDEAHKWYYKEFTDYTNANAFDAIMKAIYPFWTYETQRWFWLPRSFVRHPGTFTSYERWQDNSEYGYIHIPGTSIDFNPFRGTVYGTLTTRLSRRDFPEYYDSLGAAGEALEVNDFLSRWGFYPGAHIGIPITLFFGQEMQFGEALPSIFKTPLEILVAEFPDNESVRWISERVFGDRFRTYMTMITVNRMGGKGTLIFAKMQENKPLTPEEKQVWADARREIGWYSAAFQQFSLFRWRTDEQYKLYEEAAKVIEEITGYTVDQQEWLREHNYRLWDMVGGMTTSQSAMLKELGYYKWMGQVRPLLPGREQEILNRIEIGWDDIEKFGESKLSNNLRLQQEFLSGVIGPDKFLDGVADLQAEQRQFVVDRMAQELTKPLPEGLSKAEREEFIEMNSIMTLEGRKEYYKEFKKPLPVLHPQRELLNLFFSIKLEDTINPETGELMKDWDNFWAQRQAIDDSISDEFRQEWDDFLAKNTTRMMSVYRETSKAYFRPYSELYEAILDTYSEEEQRMIEEFDSLERLGINQARRDEIQETMHGDKKLMPSFRADLRDTRRALRYKNPHLDAWLNYWQYGGISTFLTPEAEVIFKQITIQTGRKA